MEPLLSIGIHLPERGTRTLLHDLHRQLRSAIVEGRLRPGLRLPSTRSIAETYGVSRNTAVAAYDLLLGEGYIVARRGSGTEVAASLPTAPGSSATRKARSSRFQRVVPIWRSMRVVSNEKRRPAPRWFFRLGVPDAESFPVEVWRRLSIRESRSMRTAKGLETDLQGLRALRDAIARHVSFTRAVACAPEDIIVTAGAQQAFDLLARVLITPRRTCVALEDPGYPPLRAAFKAACGRVAAVPVDHDGLVVDKLPSNADIVCVTPSHQFPLGCVLSARRRAELCDFARARNAVIIEDDYDGEFRYTNRPLDALQTLDRQESVFYVGTFSKSLLPTLRLGYIVTPRWARSPLLAAKAVSEGPCCGLNQGVLAALITGGHLARHVRKMQRVYAQRRQILIDLIHRDLSRWLEPIPSAAGLHIAAALRLAVRDTSIEVEALRQGVGVRALSAFASRRSAPTGLVFGFGAISDADIAGGVAALRRVLTSADHEARGAP
ncbi:MAG: PLP-dependent aminotransferase family protein [Steroidobacteraceae bacterium]|jgi:GntR family transcriptional regulator/MocR family aminotransferase